MAKKRANSNTLTLINSFERELNFLIGEIGQSDNVKTIDRKISIILKNNMLPLSKAVLEDVSAKIHDSETAKRVFTILTEMNARGSRFYDIDEDGTDVVSELEAEKRFRIRIIRFLAKKRKSRNERQQSIIDSIIGDLEQEIRTMDSSESIQSKKDPGEVEEIADIKEGKEKLPYYRHLWSWLKRHPTQVKRFALNILKGSRFRRYTLYLTLISTLGFSMKEVAAYFYDTPLRPPEYITAQIYPKASSIKEVGPSQLLKDLMDGKIIDPTFVNTEEATCARYVTIGINSIFSGRVEGYPAAELMGAYGSAWQYRDNMLKRGGKIIWQETKYGMNGKEFLDYSNPRVGDILGIHFTRSDYNNESTTGYTHIGLVLGSRLSNHAFKTNNALNEFCERYGIKNDHHNIIATFQIRFGGITYHLKVIDGILGYETESGFVPLNRGDNIEVNEIIMLHYWHSKSDKYAIMDPNDKAARLESVQHFFSYYGHLFRIKDVLRPKEGLVEAYVQKQDYVKYRAVPYKVAKEDFKGGDVVENIIAKNLISLNLIPLEGDVEFMKDLFYKLNPNFSPDKEDKKVFPEALVYVPTSTGMSNSALNREMGFIEGMYRLIGEKWQQGWEFAGIKPTPSPYFTEEKDLTATQQKSLDYIKNYIEGRRGYLKTRGVNLSDHDVEKWAKTIAEVTNTTNRQYLDLFLRIVEEESKFQTDYFKRIPHNLASENELFRLLFSVIDEDKVVKEKKLWLGWLDLYESKVLFRDSVVPSFMNPTIGPMQVNLKLARFILETYFQKKFTLPEVKAVLMTVRGGLLVGKIVLDQIINFYGGLNNDTLQFIHFDYGNGLGTCKDAAVQQMLADLGYDINVDGVISKRTREIIKKFIKDNGFNVSTSEINQLINSRRSKKMEETKVYSLLVETYRSQLGHEPRRFVIPTGKRYVKTPFGISEKVYSKTAATEFQEKNRLQ